MTVSTAETTFYATPTYQVRLLLVEPGKSLTTSDYERGIWLPMANGLTNEETQAVSSGHCVSWASPKAKLTNQSSTGIRVLELAWGDIPKANQKPLQEVTETRPWGSFTVLADEPDFKLKQLWTKPGNRLSLQRHQKREEHWFVTAGQPTITLNEDTLTPSVGDYVHIPLHAWHRLANADTEGVEIIELQLGSYFGEDDIERQSDDYGRQ